MTASASLRILSLGAGVQSTTLLLMACEGEFVPGLDAAIFADTGWEPASVYRHLDKITVVAADAGIPVLRVSKGNLRDDLLSANTRYASIPYFTQGEPGPCQRCDSTGKTWLADADLPDTPANRLAEPRKCPACKGTGWDDGKGMGRRQCTSEYKTAPIGRKVRELLGARPPDFRRVPKGRVCEQWIGFSADEIGRVSDHDRVSYVIKRYPLIELRMDRKACERWLKRRGWDSVAKSACKGCPYHGNRMWRDMRDNRPDEWADAVAFDAAIRKGGARGDPLKGEAFLHRSRIPLALAPIDRKTASEWKDHQGDLLDLLADIEEGDPDGCSPYGCRSGQQISGVSA